MSMLRISWNGGQGTRNQQRSAIVRAAHRRSARSQFRQYISACCCFRLDHLRIFGVPTELTSRSRASRLQACASRENDHQIFAEIIGLLLLPGAQTFARADH